MLARVRYFLSDLAHWLALHRWPVLGAVAVLAAIAGGAVYVASQEDDSPGSGPAPAPQVIVQQVPAEDTDDTADLGFPAFATKNTTRVAGADAVANAAAIALAVHPSTGPAPGPAAVSLVDIDDWQGAVAASALVGGEVGAPLLVTDGDEVPELTASALRELGPEGSSATAGRQAFVIGAAAPPDQLESLTVDGADPAELAADVDRLRERLAGDPEHIVVASSEAPGYALPAAGWAARSGDPVLFVGKDSVPEATIEALRRHDGVPVFALGPESVIAAKTMTELERIAPGAKRVGAEGAVENAIAFSRFADGDFGWNINDPGHGFVIVNTDEPLSGAVASPLSASGTWGPLLLTDDGAALPSALRAYLRDLKPGYDEDPTRALYNHVWLIGDTSALSVDLQAEVDQIAELAPVTSGSGTTLGPAPGEPESQPDEPEPDASGDQTDDQ